MSRNGQLAMLAMALIVMVSGPIAFLVLGSKEAHAIALKSVLWGVVIVALVIVFGPLLNHAESR